MSAELLDYNRCIVARGQLHYCPNCKDAYGQIGNRTKRCECAASETLPETSGGSDFPTPFEVCWYCQAEIIRSGSKWSAYYCGSCRPVIVELNGQLDAKGEVSLPVGRHTTMHLAWRHARPFTTAPLVRDWSRGRLATAWSNYSPSKSGTDWFDFSRFVHGVTKSTQAHSLLELSVAVQKVEPDSVADMIRLANARIDFSRARSD